MSKAQGTSSELLFRYECIKKNIVPSTPDIDDGCGFDVITSYLGSLLKVQIKSTNTRAGTGYRTQIGRGSKSKLRYTKEHCDIVAVHIIELKVWYIIPIENLNSINISLFPNKLNHKYSKFLNAWHLLAS